MRYFVTCTLAKGTATKISSQLHDFAIFKAIRLQHLQKKHALKPLYYTRIQ